MLTPDNLAPWCKRRDSRCVSPVECGPGFQCRHARAVGDEWMAHYREQETARWPWLSRSYPFMSIARHFGVPYADVLAMADLVEFGGTELGTAMDHVCRRERDRKAGLLGPLEAGK